MKLTNISCRKVFYVPRDVTTDELRRYTHLPPEVLLEPPAAYTAACEMYSVGILMWELWTGNRAYETEIQDPGNGIDSMGSFVDYVSTNRPSLVMFYEEETGESKDSSKHPTSAEAETWIGTIQKCWAEGDRPSCESVLKCAKQWASQTLMPMSERHFEK